MPKENLIGRTLAGYTLRSEVGEGGTSAVFRAEHPTHGIVAVKDGEVTQADMSRVIDAARAVAIPLDREVIHILPQEFIIDEQDGIKEPLGMSGVRLEAKVQKGQRAPGFSLASTGKSAVSKMGRTSICPSAAPTPWQ